MKIITHAEEEETNTMLQCWLGDSEIDRFPQRGREEEEEGREGGTEGGRKGGREVGKERGRE